MPSGQLLELNAILAARNQSPSTYFVGAGYKDCSSLRNSGVAGEARLDADGESYAEES